MPGPVVGCPAAACTSPLGITNGFAVGLGSLTGSSHPQAVDRCSNPHSPSPSLHLHYQASALLRDGPPLCPASVLCLSPSPRLEVLPFPASRREQRGDRFSRSAWEPEPSSRRLCAGHHLGGRPVSPRLVPEHSFNPGFDVVQKFSTRHQRFACARLLDSHLMRSRRTFSHDAQHPGS